MVLRRVPRFARPEEAESEPGSPSGPADPDRARSAAKLFRRQELTHWLVHSHGLRPTQARATAQRLMASAPSLRGAFQRWWLTGRLSDLEVGGYDLRRLVEEKGMSPLGALLTLSLMEGQVTSRELEERREGEIDLQEALERTGV